MIFIINLTRGQMRFLTSVARVTCLVLDNRFILFQLLQATRFVCTCFPLDPYVVLQKIHIYLSQ